MKAETKTAIKDGIAARALELGFARKSDRRYLKAENGFNYSLRFEVTREGLFVDYLNIRSRSLEQMIEASGLKVFHEMEEGGELTHISLSAYMSWAKESEQSLRRYRISQHQPWWKIWSTPSEEPWRAQDPFTQSPFTGEGGWNPAADPEACAEVSRETWEARVEPCMAEITDKRSFAGWYSSGAGCFHQPLARAFAWVDAGEVSEAQKILQSQYDERLATFEEAKERLFEWEPSFKEQNSEQELVERVEISLEVAKRNSDRAATVAQYLGIELRSEAVA